MISDWYYPKIGGTEYSIDSLARNLDLLGHEVHIITRGPGISSHSILLKVSK